MTHDKDYKIVLKFELEYNEDEGINVFTYYNKVLTISEFKLWSFMLCGSKAVHESLIKSINIVKFSVQMSQMHQGFFLVPKWRFFCPRLQPSDFGW